jgi:hypothetical protein
LKIENENYTWIFNLHKVKFKYELD